MSIEEAIRQKRFESPLHKALVNLIYTHNWFQDIQNRLFEQFDITAQQYNVLRILKGKYPNSICAGDIKAVMLDKNPDLTRLCDRLIKKELVERQYNDFNRRQVLIKITSKGIALLDKIAPEMKKYAKNIHINDKEAILLSDLLDKLRG